jgi:hypothetical protein
MQSHKKIDLKRVGARMDAGGIASTSIATASGNKKPSTMVLWERNGLAVSCNTRNGVWGGLA